LVGSLGLLATIPVTAIAAGFIHELARKKLSKTI